MHAAAVFYERIKPIILCRLYNYCPEWNISRETGYKRRSLTPDTTLKDRLRKFLNSFPSNVDFRSISPFKRFLGETSGTFCQVYRPFVLLFFFAVFECI